MKIILLGTIGYMLVTFPYALVWHMKLFHEKYKAWGYFGENPSPMIGLISMVFQGSVLSYGYGLLSVEHTSMVAGIKYALIMGIFFWSCHVVAAMAKNEKLRNGGFFCMETIYLAGQFTLFGIVISYIYQII